MSAQSPIDMKKHRRGKYKYTTPPWKEVYRKRCVKRLQEGRSKLIEQFRRMDKSENAHFVKEVMEEQWDVLRKEKDNFLSCDPLKYNPFALDDEFGPNEDLNDIIDIMEEIQNELIMQEQLMLSKYEDGLQFEEERLCAALECLQTDDVICPVCKKNPLLQNKHIIFCACGIRVDTEIRRMKSSTSELGQIKVVMNESDAVTLDFVKTQLRDAVEQHRGEGCLAEAIFSVSSYPELGVSNLIMACKNCDFLAVIL